MIIEQPLNELFQDRRDNIPSSQMAVSNCCVFRPAFGCCAHSKAGRNTFFSRFQLFLFILNPFQWFHHWNQQKRLKKNKKKCFFCFLLTPQNWSTCKSWSSPWGRWGVPQNCLFSVDFLLLLVKLYLNRPFWRLKNGNKKYINLTQKTLKNYQKKSKIIRKMLKNVKISKNQLLTKS